MNGKDRAESEELKSIVFALTDTQAEGTTLFRISKKAQLPVSCIQKHLEKHPDYFVNIAGSGFYALNRFGPYKGDSHAIIESIDREARAASSGRQVAAVLFFFVIAWWGLT